MVRRLSGPAAQPLPGPVLVPLAAGIAAASVLLRLWLLPVRLETIRQRSASGWWLVTVPSLALAALLSALLAPGTSWPAGLAALFFAGAIEGLFWRHLAVALRSGAEVFPPRPSSEFPLPEVLDESSADEIYPADLLQQLVRTRREGGGESLSAALRAEFQPGEQVQVLHVSFCPPLAAAPKLEAFVAGEIDAEAKVTSAFTFGARLEVHLPLPAAERVSLMVEVSGQS
jgi:hypothetical protein